METVKSKLVKYILSDHNISKFLVKQVYNRKHTPKSAILPLCDISNCSDNILTSYYPKGKHIAQLPKFDHREPKEVTTEIPQVALFKFENAFVHTDCSSLVFNNKILVTRTAGERYNEGFLKVHDEQNGKVFLDEPEALEEGFFLGGNGSWNWFHFLVELAPKLLLLEKGHTNTLLVNEVVEQIPSMKEILDLLNEHNFEIRYLSRNKTYHVKKLFYINDFNHVQFNRFDEKIEAEGTYYNREITKTFSDKIVGKLATIENTPTHLFLYRKSKHRVARNQEQLADFLKSKGFTLVCMEELSLVEQISYFKNAKFIVGISGAAWANIIFSRNRPKAICFVSEIAKKSYLYSGLGEIFDVNFFEQSYSDAKSFHSSDFSLDLDHFQMLYNSIDEK